MIIKLYTGFRNFFTYTINRVYTLQIFFNKNQKKNRTSENLELQV